MFVLLFCLEYRAVCHTGLVPFLSLEIVRIRRMKPPAAHLEETPLLRTYLKGPNRMWVRLQFLETNKSQHVHTHTGLCLVESKVYAYAGFSIRARLPMGCVALGKV